MADFAAARDSIDQRESTDASESGLGVKDGEFIGESPGFLSGPTDNEDCGFITTADTGSGCFCGGSGSVMLESG
jgi:hypothetical protein